IRCSTTSYTLSLHDALPIYELHDVIPTPVVLARGIERDDVRVAEPLKNFDFAREAARDRLVARDLRQQDLKRGDLAGLGVRDARSEEHTSELQSRENLVCRL